MKEKLHLRGWVKTLLVIVVLELILVSYLFLYSDRITNIEEHEKKDDIANVYLER